MSAGLRTSELAAAAGVNTQTLRYYERRGLLAEPDRTLGGHRVYHDQALTVLRGRRFGRPACAQLRLMWGAGPVFAPAWLLVIRPCRR
ncbi:MerR family DNA-binding transcriptional regulator [Nocardia miyunensis]|uniref:MerR family DNA-binding transcriptional regulator n=1 Tax=Nocardia miyunensis TaxID=282684 RepID=UPI000834170C